jgi:hypothetical protein
MEQQVKRTPTQQADYAAAQIICPPPDGGNNAPEIKKMLKEQGDKK